MEEERNIIKSVKIYIEENYIFPFLTRLCDKKKCLEKKKMFKGIFYLFLVFQDFGSKEYLRGPRKLII